VSIWSPTELTENAADRVFRKFLPNEVATQDLAKTVAVLLQPPFVMTLGGEIGAGKTTFVRALLRAMKIEGAIKSPTFSLVETYAVPGTDSFFHHFDLYRIVDAQELEYIGFRDYFTPHALCCIEWPERAQKELGSIDLHMELTWKAEGREVEFVSHSPKGQSLLAQLLRVKL
jgi:tRNA threonylcarbamoyladenosine biosynthesis protein TsaE